MGIITHTLQFASNNCIYSILHNDTTGIFKNIRQQLTCFPSLRSTSTDVYKLCSKINVQMQQCNHLTTLVLLVLPKTVHVGDITSPGPAAHLTSETAVTQPESRRCPSQWLTEPEYSPSAAVLNRPSSLWALGVGGSESLTDSSLWACLGPYGERLCTCNWRMLQDTVTK